MRVEHPRANVFTLTLAGPELSALIAGARMALDALHRTPEASAEATALLEGVLDDFDRARRRLEARPHNGDRP
jgi:hypothetical protein